MQTTPKPQNANEYVALFQSEVKALLEKLRKTVMQAAPKAEEYIGYEMIGYKLKGSLIYFAAFKKHIGLYPGPQAIEVFKEQLAGYKTSKGTIQFPLDKPIPFDLVTEIVKFRAEQNLNKETKSRTKK